MEVFGFPNKEILFGILVIIYEKDQIYVHKMSRIGHKLHDPKLHYVD